MLSPDFFSPMSSDIEATSYLVFWWLFSLANIVHYQVQDALKYSGILTVTALGMLVKLVFTSDWHIL